MRELTNRELTYVYGGNDDADDDEEDEEDEVITTDGMAGLMEALAKAFPGSSDARAAIKAAEDLQELALLIDSALVAGELVAMDDFQEALGSVIGAFLGTASGAFITSFLAGLGTLAGGPVGTAIGGVTGVTLDIIIGELGGYQAAGEWLAGLVITATVGTAAAINAAATQINYYVNQVGDAATDLASEILSDPGTALGVPTLPSIPGPSDDDDDGPKTIFDFFDEAPPPGYEWR